MDFSSALHAEAANIGLGNFQDVQRGTSVDFLARTILGDKAGEAHTALSDAQQQLRLFEKTNSMIDEIRSGKISTTTMRSLEKLAGAKTYESTRLFASSTANILQELRSNGEVRLIDSSISRETTRVDVLDTETGKSTSVQRYSAHANYSSDPEVILDNVLKRFQGVKTSGLSDTKKKSIMEDILGLDTLDEQIKYAEDLEIDYRDKRNAFIGAGKDIGDVRKAAVQESFVAALDKIKDLSKSKKALGVSSGVLLAAGAIAVVSSGSDKQVTKNKEMKSVRSQASNQKHLRC